MPHAWTVEPLLEGTGYSSSCTLVTSRDLKVVVDTGLSFMESDLRRALHKKGIEPADIDLVINTHVHVDHCGNNAIFPRALIYLSEAEWRWTDAFYNALFASRTPERVAPQFYPELESHNLKPRTIRNATRMARLFWKRERLGADERLRWLERSNLPPGLEVLATPGHTPHHVSILVAGHVGGHVAATGPVVIAGDAVLAEDLQAKVTTMIPHTRALYLATRQRLLDRGVTIVPGHGPTFTPHPVEASSV